MRSSIRAFCLALMVALFIVGAFLLVLNLFVPNDAIRTVASVAIGLSFGALVIGKWLLGLRSVVSPERILLRLIVESALLTIAILLIALAIGGQMVAFNRSELDIPTTFALVIGMEAGFFIWPPREHQVKDPGPGEMLRDESGGQ